MKKDGTAEVRWVHVVNEGNNHYLLLESDDLTLIELLKLSQPPPLTISAARVRIPIILPSPKET